MAHRDRSLFARCCPFLRCLGACHLPVVVVVLVYLVIGPASPAGAQEAALPWVMVAIPDTPDDEGRNEILAEVIADTVELTLKLVGDYVIQPRPEALASPVSPAEAAAVAHSLFETFPVADALSADLLGAFTGQRIAYGSIELVNEAPDPGAYRVLVDGELVGTSLELMERILIGPRRIEIVGEDGTRIGGDMLIAEGHRSRLRFSVAELPEEAEPPEALADQQKPEEPAMPEMPP